MINIKVTEQATMLREKEELEKKINGALSVLRLLALGVKINYVPKKI